jgi:hypothetical protein
MGARCSRDRGSGFRPIKSRQFPKPAPLRSVAAAVPVEFLDAIKALLAPFHTPGSF